MKLTKTFIENLRKAISADLHAHDFHKFIAAHEIALILDQDEVSRKDIKTLVKAMYFLRVYKKNSNISILTLDSYVHFAATEEDLVDADIIEA